MKSSILFVIFLLFLSACSKRENSDLVIAAAANLYPVLPQIIDSFEKQHKIKTRVVYRSSGMLYASIKEGAQYDVFLSANKEGPNKLFKNKIASKPFHFANGIMAVFSLKDSALLQIDSWKNHHSIKIAIANPKSAPFGKTTVEFLKQKKCFKMIQHQIVYGENIQQVNQFLLSGAADVGVTSASLKSIKSEGYFNIINSEFNSDLSQTAQTIKPHKNEAKLFVEFLHSETVKAILNNNGYNCIP